MEAAGEGQLRRPGGGVSAGIGATRAGLSLPTAHVAGLLAADARARPLHFHRARRYAVSHAGIAATPGAVALRDSRPPPGADAAAGWEHAQVVSEIPAAAAGGDRRQAGVRRRLRGVER